MMPRPFLLLGALLFGAVLAAPLATPASSGLTAQAVGGEGRVVSSQTLKPGDVVKLGVWREPDFSGDFLVDEAGFVTLPRLGDIRVLDFTAASLEAELLERFRQYLRNPSIEISVLRRIRILGAVREPGLYQVDPTTTLADAIALAGGVTPQGKQDVVELRRGGELLVAEVNANVSLGDTPLRSGDQLFVPERSWFSRNTNILAAGIGAVVTLIVALSR